MAGLKTPDTGQLTPAFEPQIFALSSQPDGTLIRELKTRGYRIIREEQINTCGATADFEKDQLLRIGEDTGFREHVFSSLGARLGSLMMRDGFIPVQKEDVTLHRVSYRATATIIATEPNIIWPFNRGARK